MQDGRGDAGTRRRGDKTISLCPCHPFSVSVSHSWAYFPLPIPVLAHTSSKKASGSSITPSLEYATCMPVGFFKGQKRTPINFKMFPLLHFLGEGKLEIGKHFAWGRGVLSKRRWEAVTRQTQQKEQHYGYS